MVTRGQATLDKIWTNMVEVYTSPVTISELGTSDHSMVLWEPKCNKSVDTGKLIYVTVRCMGPNEKETFAKALSAIKWEALYRLETCEEQYAYYQTIIDKLMQMCFPTKMVSRHTSDKPWITDRFRSLVRKRQRAHMSGDVIQVRVLRNKVNHTASKLKHDFYQTHIASLSATGSHDWWKHMKTIMGLNTSGNACMQGVVNKIANGDYGILADRMNDFLISVSDKLPRLKKKITQYSQ